MDLDTTADRGGPHVRVVIELDDADPPSGRVRREGGRAVPFDGWLGLLKTLTEAFQGDATTTDGAESEELGGQATLRDLRRELDP